MGDTIRTTPDHDCLFATASEQHGYFTTQQARACGFGTALLAHHTRRGRFIHEHRGVYRLRDYPSSPREEVVAAWLAVGKEKAVVSHDSALDLLELSDIIPDAVHLTVPRSTRNLPNLPGVQIHTSQRPLAPNDITSRDGIRLTSAARTIVDAAEAGIGPEQIELAVDQAIQRGLSTRRLLEQAASERNRRVQNLIQQSLVSSPR